MNTDEKISVHQLICYFTIFSIIGLFIETIYCFITTGNLECRQGLIWGPFCPVYGFGATFLILILNKFKNNIAKLFFYGAIAGSIAEYVMSYMLEAIYKVRFWDYSYTYFHLNGRICLTYSVFWAILSVILILFVKPLIDKLILYNNSNLVKCFDIFIVMFLTIDIIFTVWGISVYKQRALNVYYNQNCSQNNITNKIENKLFSNNKMKLIFPNIRFYNEKKEEIWIRDLI